jgi:hypothetical protein
MRLIDRTGQTMVNKIIFYFWLFGCISIAEATPHIGFVDVKDGKMFLHTDAQPAEIHVAYLQYPGRSNRCCIRVLKAQIRSEDGLAESDKVSGEKPIYVYAVTTPSQVLLNRPFLGMALINVDRPVSARGHRMRGYSNSRLVEVSQCFGMEGLNLNVVRTPSSIAPVYYSVGYEIDLTTVANDMRCK